jgi:hypothetical protein
MADFSNSGDEIPYPLPPTMVAPTTTKETEALIVFKVPTSSSACDTGTLKLPKNNSFLVMMEEILPFGGAEWQMV